MENSKILHENNLNNTKNCSGRWSKAQHQRFLESLKLYGKNWKKIQEYIGTRTGAQIRSHSQKFFSRLQKQIKKDTEDSQNNNKFIEQSYKENYANQIFQNKTYPFAIQKKQCLHKNDNLISNLGSTNSFLPHGKHFNSQSFFKQFFPLNQINLIDLNVFSFIELKSSNDKTQKLHKTTSFQEFEANIIKKTKFEHVSERLKFP